MVNKKKLPQLVASDIGGTLIRGINSIPHFTGAVLNRLVEKNIPVALVTGYNYHITMKFARDLDERILLLPQNGALCVKEKELVWEYRIPGYDVNDLYNYLDENDLPIIIYQGKNGGFKNYYISRNEIPDLSYGFERMFRLNGCGNITGISTMLPDVMAKEVKVKLQEIVGDRFKVIYTRGARGSWLEVSHTDVRKDLALKRLCEELSIPLANVLYFGDNFNDLEAMRIVGRPVLVENAAPELKKEFDTIIPPVYEEGVAHYLNDLYHLGFR
ncbi:MAG: HAD family phosphatase [Candidatus Aminicenantes bacterium]|nr:MAG: HAD family phosphatase [Candidatus Aminicenantes bacterium]